jgi:hypothetical protein
LLQNPNRSMRVVLFPSGTRGDFQPLLALAVGLKGAGHDPLLVCNPRRRRSPEAARTPTCSTACASGSRSCADVYAVHGSNTWGESHHRRLMEILGVVPIGGREAELARGLAELGLRAVRDPGDGIEAMRIVP